MKLGSVIFVLVVVGFFGMEIYAAKRNMYRTKPAYIYAQYVSAAHANSVCGSEEAVDHEKFQRNFAYTERRARDEILAEDTEPKVADAERRLREIVSTARASVDELLGEKGCDDIEAWKLKKRYAMFARQNPPI